MKRAPAAAIAFAVLLSGVAGGQEATPRDPKSPIPGHADGRGPTGPVELKIISPRPEEIVPIPPPAPGQPAAKGAPATLKFELKNYETFLDPATRTGQGIAIVLDAHPPQVLYDSTKGWTYRSLPKGTHTVRAFPVRPWQESIKEPGAFATVTFHVGEKDGKNTPLPGAPLLTPNQPKGKYPKSEAGRILLDFYVTGCRVVEGNSPDACRVRYRVDQLPEVKLTKWVPAWLENLSAGRHAYVLGLTRGERVIENGPFNLVQETFEIEEGGAPASPR